MGFSGLRAKRRGMFLFNFEFSLYSNTLAWSAGFRVKVTRSNPVVFPLSMRLTRISAVQYSCTGSS
jgi:hypothetical protein